MNIFIEKAPSFYKNCVEAIKTLNIFNKLQVFDFTLVDEKVCKVLSSKNGMLSVLDVFHRRPLKLRFRWMPLEHVNRIFSCCGRSTMLKLNTTWIFFLKMYLLSTNLHHCFLKQMCRTNNII